MYNKVLQRRFDRACEKAARDPRGPERAFIGKSLVGVGAVKMEQLNNHVMAGHEIDVGAHLQLRNLKVRLSRGRLAGGKKRIISRYGFGGSAPIASLAPKLDVV